MSDGGGMMSVFRGWRWDGLGMLLTAAINYVTTHGRRFSHGMALGLCACWGDKTRVLAGLLEIEKR